MNKILKRRAYELVAEGRLQECIALFEEELRKIPSTRYHTILGRELLHLTGGSAGYLIQSVNEAVMDLKVVYLEMNGFVHNTRQWHIHPFGFLKYPGIDLEDLEWLSSPDTPDNFANKPFIITGFEDIQRVFHDMNEAIYDNLETRDERNARNLAEHLVRLRMQELTGAAHREAAERDERLKHLVVLSTSHDDDLIYESALLPLNPEVRHGMRLPPKCLNGSD